MRSISSTRSPPENHWQIPADHTSNHETLLWLITWPVIWTDQQALTGDQSVQQRLDMFQAKQILLSIQTFRLQCGCLMHWPERGPFSCKQIDTGNVSAFHWKFEWSSRIRYGPDPLWQSRASEAFETPNNCIECIAKNYIVRLIIVRQIIRLNYLRISGYQTPKRKIAFWGRTKKSISLKSVRINWK